MSKKTSSAPKQKADEMEPSTLTAAAEQEISKWKFESIRDQVPLDSLFWTSNEAHTAANYKHPQISHTRMWKRL